jgi:hypothetical protein
VWRTWLILLLLATPAGAQEGRRESRRSFEIHVPLARPLCVVRDFLRHVVRVLDDAESVRAEWIAEDQRQRRFVLPPPERSAQQPTNPGVVVIVPVAYGRFDPGGDRPERARALGETREARGTVVAEANEAHSRAAVRELSTRLERIWDDERVPIAARKELLFELWDECEETGLGLTARTTIIGFIARRLPHAYTAAELTALNARRTSKMRFAPY